MRRLRSYHVKRVRGSGFRVRGFLFVFPEPRTPGPEPFLLTFRALWNKLLFMFMPSALSKAVERIARRAVGKDWNLYAALLEHLQEIVGAEYARVAAPVKITFPHQPNAPRR